MCHFEWHRLGNYAYRNFIDIQYKTFRQTDFNCMKNIDKLMGGF